MFNRIGVKKGGCSGMSYDMNWVNELEILDSDHIEYFDNIKCAIDPKSLLFLFGMELDYRSVYYHDYCVENKI